MFEFTRFLSHTLHFLKHIINDSINFYYFNKFLYNLIISIRQKKNIMFVKLIIYKYLKYSFKY